LVHNNIETTHSTRDLYSGKSDDILSIKTHYEKLFLAAGMKINYLSFQLEKEKTIENVTVKAKDQ
jgi:hypothetical protein